MNSKIMNWILSKIGVNSKIIKMNNNNNSNKIYKIYGTPRTRTKINFKPIIYNKMKFKITMIFLTGHMVRVIGSQFKANNNKILKNNLNKCNKKKNKEFKLYFKEPRNWFLITCIDIFKK